MYSLTIQIFTLHRQMGHILWSISTTCLSLSPLPISPLPISPLPVSLSLSLSVCGGCNLSFLLSDESYLESYKLCSTIHSRYSRPPAHWYTTDCSQGLQSGEGKDWQDWQAPRHQGHNQSNYPPYRAVNKAKLVRHSKFQTEMRLQSSLTQINSVKLR